MFFTANEIGKTIEPAADENPFEEPCVFTQFISTSSGAEAAYVYADTQ